MPPLSPIHLGARTGRLTDSVARHRGVALIAAALLLAVPRARAQQIVGLTPRSAEVGFEYGGSWRRYSDGPGSEDAAYREWVTLPLSGALVDSRILSYAFTLRPAFAQRTSTGLANAVSSRQLGIDFGARLLSARRVSLSLSALRSAGSTRGGFGGQSDFELSSLSAHLMLRSRILPTTADYSSRSTADAWVAAPGLAPIRREETVRTLRLAAQNSRTSASLQRMTADNRFGDGDFSSLDANLDHAVRWGKGSSIASSVQYTDRAGSSPYRRTAWAERLHLQHTANTGSDLSYQRLAWESNGVSTRSRSLAASTSSRVRRWLHVGVQASARSAQYPSGRDATYALAPQVGYHAALPLGARLSGGFSLGYEWYRRNVADGWAQALNERHVVEPIRSFFLDRPGAEARSVVVRNADETVVYLPDVDYRLVESGPLIQVQVPPGSRIEMGQSVLVSYRYRIAPGQRYEVTTVAYDAALSVAGLHLGHRRSVRDGQPLGRAGAVLTDYDESSTRVGTSRATPAGRLQVDAERRRRRSAEHQYATYQVRSTLALPARSTFQSAVSATGSSTLAGGRRTSVTSVQLSGTWLPSATLRFQAGVDAWAWKQDGGAFERFLGVSLDTEWRFGSVLTALRYEHHRRKLPIAGLQDRLSVRLVRTF